MKQSTPDPDIAPSLETSISPVEKYREFLATKGLRLTRERSIIVEEVFASHEHFDAEQLMRRVTYRTDGRRVSRATAYRSLSLLEEAGMLRRIARQDGREIYEHEYGYPHHDHLICKKCGTLCEFHNEAISELLDEIARQHGFRMEGHRLEVSGLCKTCSRPPATRPKKLNLL